MEFDNGEFVYCPAIGSKAYQVQVIEDSFIQVDEYTFDKFGRFFNMKGVVVFKATPETQKKLMELYGYAFETPTATLKGMALAKKLKTDFWAVVTNDINVYDECLKDETELMARILQRVSYCGDVFRDEFADSYKYAIPVDIDANETRRIAERKVKLWNI